MNLRFIIFHFKSNFSYVYLSLLFLYLSFAWLLNDPNINKQNLFDSHKTTGPYDLLLMSVILITFLLFIVKNFNNEIGSEKKAILLTRMNEKSFLWNLITAYYLFFLIGFILPLYLTALIQQYIYYPQRIIYEVYILKILCGIFGNTLIWITCSLWLTIKFREPFIVLVNFVLVYIVLSFLNFITKGLLFNHFWFYDIFFYNYSNIEIAGILTIWLLIIYFTYKIISRLALILMKTDLIQPYKNGIYSKSAGLLNLSLTKYHIKMIDLQNLRILFLFTFVGLLLIISVMKYPNTDLFILGKIYIGAFVPLVFSFNQYDLIQIDSVANMMHNNILRELKYSKIIFNRWLVLLLPQIIIIILYTFILSLAKEGIGIEFTLYILLLNVSFNSLNLFLSILINTSNATNIILFFIVYIQLRADIQKILNSSYALEKINILSPLLQKSNYHIISWYWLILFIIISITIFLTVNMLSRMNYESLENN